MPATAQQLANLRNFSLEERRINQRKAADSRKRNKCLRILKGEKSYREPTKQEVLDLVNKAITQVAEIKERIHHLAPQIHKAKLAQANILKSEKARPSAKQPHPIDRDAHLLDQLTPPRLAR